MSTTESNGTQTVESLRSRPKRPWELIALVAVVAVLIVGEIVLQWAKHPWDSVWDGLQILGIIAMLALVQSWIVRRDRVARREMAPAAARPIRAKLPSIGLGVLGSLAGLVLLALWRGVRLSETVGEGMMMILIIGPALVVVCLLLGAVAGWVSVRKPSSRWAALIGGLIVGFVAASATYLVMMTTFV